jgi:hypothetical protein
MNAPDSSSVADGTSPSAKQNLPCAVACSFRLHFAEMNGERESQCHFPNGESVTPQVIRL